MPMEKTFDAATGEPEVAARWDAAHAFAAGAGKRRDEAFSIVLPPPNVTGALHMGHAFNATLQDILVRWHRMRGFDTLWQAGTDHAGIATQMVVERELAKEGTSRVELGREAFTARVWEQKARSEGAILGQLKRLGASCDWARTAFTMDEGFQRAVMKVFVDLYDAGKIYRGKRLVNWDPQFETAISDLEVETVEVDGFMWHFRYPLEGGATYDYVERDADGRETLRETRDYISIATTRPETMLGDGAIAVHPSDERYAPIVGKRCEIPVGPKAQRRLIPIIADPYPDPAFGSGAVKITGAHDFNDYAVAERHGIPKYRLMDTRAALRTDGAPYAESSAQAQALGPGATEAEIDALNLVSDAYRGLDRFAARTRIVADITAEGLAVMVPESDPRLGRASAASAGPAQAGAPGDSYEEGSVPPELALVPLVEPRRIMQPFGDRSKVVIEPMLTDQWFVDTAQIVQPAIDAVRDGRTRIVPEQHEKTYFSWLESIQPWCISRQLWWGHRIPVWHGLPVADIADALVSSDVVKGDPGLLRVYADTFDFEPVASVVRCAEDFDAARAMLSEDYSRERTPFGGSGWEVIEVESADAAAETFLSGLAQGRSIAPVWRDPDVLDTWFSSGLWPIGTLGWPEDTPELAKYFPTSVLVTGFDIVFFWVARMMMMELETTGEVPFRDVYVHALVRDADGKKMSKSLGNVIDPIALVDGYGADAVRFTLAAMAAMGRDLRLSEERVAGYRNFGTKLWNACRFAELNGVWERPAADAPPPATATANRWILGETARARAATDAALAGYRFNDAASGLYAFVWGQVCDWYVEVAKPLLADPETADETRDVMAFVLDRAILMLHPFMPFVTEALWSGTRPRDGLLCHAPWPEDAPEALADADADREMAWVIALVEEIRSARAQMHVPAGLKLAMLTVALDDAGAAALARNEALVLRLARIERLETAPAVPKGAIVVTVEGGTFALPLAGIIDIAAEKARLTKSLDKLERDMGGLRGRLGNPSFVAKAGEAVVGETREKLTLGEDEALRLRGALKRLEEVG